MKRVLALCLVLGGCVPTTQLVQDGHYTIQLTQSRNIWGQNVVHTTRCLNTEKVEGFCKPQEGPQTASGGTFSGPGVQLASSLLNAAAIAGGAAIMMHGLQTQAVSPGVNLGGNSISTLVGCGAGKAFNGIQGAPGCK